MPRILRVRDNFGPSLFFLLRHLLSVRWERVTFVGMRRFTRVGLLKVFCFGMIPRHVFIAPLSAHVLQH